MKKKRTVAQKAERFICSKIGHRFAPPRWGYIQCRRCGRQEPH